MLLCGCDFYDYIIAIKQVMPIGGKVRANCTIAVVGLVGVATYEADTLKSIRWDTWRSCGGIRRKLRMK